MAFKPTVGLCETSRIAANLVGNVLQKKAGQNQAGGNYKARSVDLTESIRNTAFTPPELTGACTFFEESGGISTKLTRSVLYIPESGRRY